MPNDNYTLSSSSQQQRIERVQFRTTPYFLIGVFSLAIMCLRIYMFPEWYWWLHPLSFVGQFVFLSLVWQFIRWLSGRLEAVIPFERGPVQRMFIQVVLVLAAVAPLVYLVVRLSRPFLPSFVNSQFLVVVIMMFTVVIVLLNFIFYASYFFRHWQRSVVDKASLEVQAAALEREKFNLQYHQLRNQVNPHYLFNTLSSLDGLIQTDPELASEFVRHMSKVYRYVLQHSESEVVSLEQELVFIGHYISLLRVRYREGLSIHCNVSEAAREKGIVMVTLQMLIDNAIKHNVVQAGAPLKIVVWDEGGFLHVYNNKQLRRQIETSNGQGLAQLRQLYGYLTETPVVIEDDDQHFCIKIPLIDL